MPHIKLKRFLALIVLFAVAAFAVPSIALARAGDNNNSPELPTPLCDSVEVPAGNRVSFHAYALGVQVYRWNGASWTFVEPVATLFLDADYHKKVGVHYLGPTWEHNNGSKVVAARLTGCAPEPTAIPWLLLQATSNEGPGIFNSVTYIQRVNTAGGLAPTAPGLSIGAVAEVPYAAEYYFYRANH